MAKVKIWKGEITRKLLPDVCAVCGREADQTKRVTFVWQQPWIIATIFLGLLIYVIVSLILRKKMVVHVPVCAKHKNHWLYPKLFLWLGLLLFVCGLVLGLVVRDDRNPNNNTISNVILIATGVWFFVVVFGAAILHMYSVRPTEITDRTITLTGLNRKFVDALEDDRDRDDEDNDRVPAVRQPRPPRKAETGKRRDDEQDDY